MRRDRLAASRALAWRFLKRAGLEMQNVSYRGNAPALNDVIAGHLPAMFSNISMRFRTPVGDNPIACSIYGLARTALPKCPNVCRIQFPRL
jgi:Tripartite tricarboxylate transporter family receptor